jgi:IS66 C-terminal element
MTALHDLSADTLSSAYRAGQRSPVEVTRAALARIDAWEGKINAMHVITADGALAQAAQCRGAMARRHASERARWGADHDQGQHRRRGHPVAARHRRRRHDPECLRRAAAIYTLIATAKLNCVDPQAWLADVLARLPDHSAKRIHELLPWNWHRQNVAADAA